VNHKKRDILFLTITYKNYKNRLRLAKVMVKNIMSRFFVVHRVHYITLYKWRTQHDAALRDTFTRLMTDESTI